MLSESKPGRRHWTAHYCYRPAQAVFLLFPAALVVVVALYADDDALLIHALSLVLGLITIFAGVFVFSGQRCTLELEGRDLVLRRPLGTKRYSLRHARLRFGKWGEGVGALGTVLHLECENRTLRLAVRDLLFDEEDLYSVAPTNWCEAWLKKERMGGLLPDLVSLLAKPPVRASSRTASQAPYRATDAGGALVLDLLPDLGKRKTEAMVLGLSIPGAACLVGSVGMCVSDSALEMRTMCIIATFGALSLTAVGLFVRHWLLENRVRAHIDNNEMILSDL